MPLVSVIIPVYNVEKFLPACVDSLLAQKLTDIELLLVDDGSKDSSGSICDRYAGKDARIRVIHTTNRGLSAARNKGIEAACGEYLMFVDADDYVSPDFCSAPYRLARKLHADIIHFLYSSVEDNGHVKRLRCSFLTRKDFPRSARRGWGCLLSREEAMQLNSLYPSCCIRLYRRELFEDISFPEGKIYEDIGTTHRLVHKAARVGFLNDYLYFYRINRKGSITTFSDDEKKLHIRDEMHAQRLQELASWGYDTSYTRARIAWSFLVHEGRQLPDSAKYEKVIHSLKHCPSQFGPTQKAGFYLYRFSPRLFDVFCRRTGRRKK